MFLHRQDFRDSDRKKYKVGDWYYSLINGLTWEYGYDAVNSCYRWFLVNPEYYYPKSDQEVESPE